VLITKEKEGEKLAVQGKKRGREAMESYDRYSGGDLTFYSGQLLIPHAKLFEFQ
jgi:hypothetical protein